MRGIEVLMESLRESDLYGPVRDYLEGLGYEVKGEVRDCDITALRDGELIVVELKRGFTLELVYQEQVPDKSAALRREIQIKRLRRAEKERLIKSRNST